MKFRVGDRVVSLVNFTGLAEGEKGVIQKIVDDGEGICSIYIRWDLFNNTRHDNGGLCPHGHGWRVSAKHIEHEEIVDFGILPKQDCDVNSLFC